MTKPSTRLSRLPGKPRSKASGTPPARKTSKTKKSAAKSGTPRGPGVRPTPAASARSSKKVPVLLSGGNPQIPKGDGDAPVRAYIAAMPGWKRAVGKRLDELIARHARGVHKAVKWNSPLYGVEGQGFFLGFHTFRNYVKVTFFRGTSLRPVPPGGKGKDARWIDIHEDDLDEAQLAAWVKQAAALPGWIPGQPF